MYHRSHRIVKLSFGEERATWVVVSPSLRDDDTWDVLHRARSRQGCEAWISEVDARHHALNS